jgi:hypothetical protein
LSVNCPKSALNRCKQSAWQGYQNAIGTYA